MGPMNTTTATATAPLSLQLEWADWNDALPTTADKDVLGKAIEHEFNKLVQDGTYPAGVSFEEYLYGGLTTDTHFAEINVSFADIDTMVAFYMTYSDCKREDAISELRVSYLVEIPAE